RVGCSELEGLASFLIFNFGLHFLHHPKASQSKVEHFHTYLPVNEKGSFPPSASSLRYRRLANSWRSLNASNTGFYEKLSFHIKKITFSTRELVVNVRILDHLERSPSLATTIQ